MPSNTTTAPNKTKAFQAIVMIAGFYLVALSVAILLMLIPVAELIFLGRMHIKLALIGFGGGLAILAKVFPRRDQFQAPGILLKPAQHPQFFSQLQTIAKQLNEKMPQEVYLIPEVNAWVADRGGWMGIGSRRVMGIGLPLLQLLTINQLRAVLAHEFGHYQSGDTKWSARLYQTRAAISRLIQDANGGWLVRYWEYFMRVTQSLSRQQEFVADRVAAKNCGANHLSDALCALHSADVAYENYWYQELIPAMQAGFLPPVAAGFKNYLLAEKVSVSVSDHLKRELKITKADPYDSHPPLPDRLTAIKSLPAAQNFSLDVCALSLLTSVPALERLLLEFYLGGEKVKPLKNVAWDQIGIRFYLPLWESLVREYRPLLLGLTPRHFKNVSEDMEKFGRRLGELTKKTLSVSDAIDLGAAVSGAAIAVHLVQAGWRLQASLGDDITLVAEGKTMQPFDVLYRLQAGQLSEEMWLQECAAYNLLDLDLGMVWSDATRAKAATQS